MFTVINQYFLSWRCFYPVLFTLCILSLFHQDLKVGLIFSLIAFLYWLKFFSLKKVTNKVDAFVVLFIVVCVISLLWEEGNSAFSNYIYGLSYTVLPACFYFYAKQLSFKEQNDVIKQIVYAVEISMFIGLLLYIAAPGFYIDFLLKKAIIPNDTLFQVRRYYQGLFGVTMTSSLCLYALIYELHDIQKKNKKRIPIFMLLFVLLIMTMRKSALFGFLFVVIFELFLSKKTNKKVILIILFIIAIIGLFAIREFPELYEAVMFRFSGEDVEDGLISRSTQATTSLANLENYMLGNGLGSAGHHAGMSADLKVVIFDNAYLLLLCEIGIVGLLAFVLSTLPVLTSKLVRNKNRYAYEIFIVILLQSLTSNMFEFIYIMPFFWFIFGVCVSCKYCKIKTI